MDDVEEGREPVDVVELARERRGEVEAETVDVALDDEVAQRVHDQPQDVRVHRVERVAGAREVHVVAPVVRHQPVVGGVVDALEREHRPEVVALGGVVVDHVEDHLDPGAVERLDHPLELAQLLAAVAGGRVGAVRRQVADRRVAPVVRQPAVDEEALGNDLVDREQLDRSDAERAQVRERGVRGEAGVGAAQILAHVRVTLREALDVHLVDDRVRPGRLQVAVALPVERRVDHDCLRHRLRVVLVVRLEVGLLGRLGAGHVGEHVGRVPVDRARDRLRIGVEQELARVEAVARRTVRRRRGRGSRTAVPGRRPARSSAS